MSGGRFALHLWVAFALRSASTHRPNHCLRLQPVPSTSTHPWTTCSGLALCALVRGALGCCGGIGAAARRDGGWQGSSRSGNVRACLIHTLGAHQEIFLPCHQSARCLASPASSRSSPRWLRCSLREHGLPGGKGLCLLGRLGRHARLARTTCSRRCMPLACRCQPHYSPAVVVPVALPACLQVQSHAVGCLLQFLRGCGGRCAARPGRFLRLLRVCRLGAGWGLTRDKGQRVSTRPPNG